MSIPQGALYVGTTIYVNEFSNLPVKKNKCLYFCLMFVIYHISQTDCNYKCSNILAYHS